jgi:hypothetical protein
MRKVTITLDELTASWVRAYAAEHNTSVSRLIRQMLQQRMKQSRDYDKPMRRFLAKKPARLKRAGTRYTAREELHDRSRLR